MIEDASVDADADVDDWTVALVGTGAEAEVGAGFVSSCVDAAVKDVIASRLLQLMQQWRMDVLLVVLFWILLFLW